MKKRQKKKLEKLKRSAVHKILDLILDINGLQASRQELTGGHPTAFFELSGQIGGIRWHVCKSGYADGGLYKNSTTGESPIYERAPFSNELTLGRSIYELEAIKKEFQGGQNVTKRI